MAEKVKTVIGCYFLLPDFNLADTLAMTLSNTDGLERSQTFVVAVSSVSKNNSRRSVTCLDRIIGAVLPCTP